MKESYVEGLASYGGPESCVHIREGVGEALARVSAGRVLSRVIDDPGHRSVGCWGCRGRGDIPPRPWPPWSSSCWLAYMLLLVMLCLAHKISDRLCRPGPVPACGGGRAEPLLRLALQRGAGAGLPLPGGPAVASHLVPPQSEQTPGLEAHASDRRSLAARPRICHPYPNQRLIVTTRSKSRVR